MKHAKKMILVEAPVGEEETINRSRDLILKKQFDENYLKPNQIFDLDQELKRTLNRTDLDDHEKWALYNQTLQRFLFHINEERKKNSINKIFQTSFNRAPTINDKFYYNREAPQIRNQFTVQEPTSKLRFQPYNNRSDKGQYDMSGRKYEQDRLNREAEQNRRNREAEQEEARANETLESVGDQQSLYESAYEIALPSDDEADYEEPEKAYEEAIDALVRVTSNEDDELMETEDIEEEKRGYKRSLDNVAGIKKKRIRQERKPVYSYAYGPPLQRWVLDLKSQSNKNRIKSVLKSLAREGIILPKPVRDPLLNEGIILPKTVRDPFEECTEIKSGRRTRPYYLRSKIPVPNLRDRTSKSTDQTYKLIKRNENLLSPNVGKNKRWERLPKLKKQPTK